MHVAAFHGSKRFEILSRLGSGGMGEVYKVFDHDLNTVVALKMLRGTAPGSLFRFKQEFRALCDISHPNLVPLYELLVVDNQWVFTMELVEGAGLLAFLRPDITMAQEGETQPAGAGPATGKIVVAPAPQKQYWQVFRQLAEAVHFLHESGKLHRDIKPSNVLVTSRGRVVVLDFGLVTALGGAALPIPTSYVLGTPGYVAPEVLSQDAPGTAAD